MPDREKVIKALSICVPETQEDSKLECGDCPYRYVCDPNDIAVGITLPLLWDIRILLKEQGTKAGAWQWKIHGKPENGGTLGEAVCDQCGKSTYATAVKGDLNYCPNCGAKMEGRRSGNE